jgi:diketogulonate reductase-like aldo/keto reductase
MGKAIPGFFYGTAWKEEETETFTFQALKLGMRGIDTANQRKHYYEVGVGLAIGRAVRERLVTREDLYLQTKFTFVGGQDHRLPYDPAESIAEQVWTSCESSLDHLKADYLDSYLLHGPETRSKLTENDWEAWRTMERLVSNGMIHSIGVSNFSGPQLKELLLQAKIKPAFVQNRCYPSIDWDAPVRQICDANGIIYQGFNLLADPLLQKSPVVGSLCTKYRAPLGKLIYSFAIQAGILPLSGARDPAHLLENLSAQPQILSEADFKAMDQLRMN